MIDIWGIGQKTTAYSARARNGVAQSVSERARAILWATLTFRTTSVNHGKNRKFNLSSWPIDPESATALPQNIVPRHTHTHVSICMARSNKSQVSERCGASSSSLKRRLTSLGTDMWLKRHIDDDNEYQNHIGARQSVGAERGVQLPIARANQSGTEVAVVGTAHSVKHGNHDC